MRRLGAAGIIIVLLTGCASIAKETESAQVSRIEVGKSTRDDVLAALGLPHKRELTGGDEARQVEVWTYFAGRGRRTVFVPIPVAGPGIAGAVFLKLSPGERKDVAAIIVFDEHGRVIDLKARGDSE